MGMFGNVLSFIKGAASPDRQKDSPMDTPENLQAPEQQSSSMPFATKEEAVTFVKKKFEKFQEIKRPIELQWRLNMNFLIGNQYCDINTYSNDIVQIDKNYEWQEREVFNQIAPIYETRLAKLKRIRPSPLVRPATGESRDISTAKVCTSITRGLDRNQAMNDKRAMATAWAEICGCAFIEDEWDVKAGRPVGEMDGQKIHEGDIKKIVRSPFEVYPNSNFAKGVTGCREMITAVAYDVEDIYNDWGIEIKGRQVDVFTLEHTNIGTGGLGYSANIYKIQTTTVENSEIVIRYTCLPSRRYPEGMIVIIAGTELLHIGPFIYRVGDDGKPGIPMVMQMCVENPGFFWPTAIIERLIPVQRGYNAVKNRKHELLNRKAIGVLTAEDDGTLDAEALEENGYPPGTILTYARGAKAPAFLTDNSSTQDFDQEEKSLESLFEKISGVSPFSTQSLPPTGVNSGIAMEKIREQDDTRIGLTAENINSAAIQSYKIDLRMYKQFAKGPRLLRYVGDNNDVYLVDWYASDITSDDVVIDKEDELAQTPAQRRQMVLDTLQYKLFSNDVDPKIRSKVISLLELGNWEDIDDIEDLHIAKALRENKRFEQGIVTMPDDFDDHSLHLREHNRYRLDVNYDTFRQMYPQIAVQFDMHVKAHEAFIQAAMQNAMMIQAAAKPQKAEAS
jgi:hypothetical protein